MTIEEIKELIRLANDTGVAELELQRGEDRVRIRRAPFEREYVGVPQGAERMVYAPQAPPQHSYAPAGGAAQPASEASSAQEEYFVIKSPIVGTYYDSPAPDSPPFVGIGDKVVSKTTVCIIESMKLMNEIEAEINGTIIAKLVENGKPVEYGEALFTVRPS